MAPELGLVSAACGPGPRWSRQAIHLGITRSERTFHISSPRECWNITTRLLASVLTGSSTWERQHKPLTCSSLTQRKHVKLLVAAKKTNTSRKGLFSKNDLGLLHYRYFSVLYVNSLYNDVCFFISTIHKHGILYSALTETKLANWHSITDG